MPIANVIERGTFLYVYNEKGEVTAVLSGSGELRGYTGSPVTVKRGMYLHVYDEQEHLLSVTTA